MTEEVLHSYEVLGLSADASPGDIKKAYFRLVRLHPPEKDPEAFQQIRRAYELLKDGPPAVEEQTFSPPDDPAVLYLIRHGVRLAQSGNEKAAEGCFAEALKLFPNDPFLLLNLARLQKNAGHPRKAAGTAQRLAKAVPGFAEAHAIAAAGFFEGGWYKKALPEYREAYRLGYRGLEFLTDYADAADASGEHPEAESLRRDLLKNTKWDSETIESSLYLFYSRAAHCPPEESSVLSFLEEYEQFLRSHRRLLKPFGVGLAAPFMSVCASQPKALGSFSVYKKMDALAETVETIFAPDSPQDTAAIRGELLLTTMDQDSRLSGSFWPEFALAALVSEVEDAGLHRYAVLDAFLCLIKDRENSLSSLPLIRSSYPYLFEKCRSEIDLLASGEKADGQIEKLKQEYARLSKNYDGGRYYSRFPEERPLPRGVLAYSDSVPFVRETKKPGRNDPCPCGSGKKFKKCCLGKGIYD